MVDKKEIFLFVCLFLVLFGVQFVLANSTITNVHFEGNVTPNYDEGVFTINWTAAGNATSNYTIYTFINNVYNNSVQNTSITNYSFSNITEANYTFTIQAANGTNVKTNYTNISMYVDRTPPLVNWTGSGYNNVTYKKNTDYLTLNISVGDASSGLTNSYCIFNINRTNETVAVSNGWCNTTQLNLTGLDDGNHTIDIWANDTVGNVGVNLSTYVVWVDTTGPTISLSKLSSTRDSITVSLSCSDAISNAISCALSSSSGTVSGNTISGLNCATSYDITANTEDDAGNTASTTLSMQTNNCGGGSVIPVLPKKVHSWTKITPGVATIMKDFDNEIGIKQISIEVNNEAQNVRITVTKYNEKPSEVLVSKSGKVYQYLHIETQNLEANLNKAEIEFRVDKFWVLNSGLEKDKVAVFKFDEVNNKWNEINTAYISEDNDFYYYAVELDSFSYFSISEKSVVSTEETETPSSTTTEEKEKANLVWLWVLIIILILLGIGYAMKEKKFF